MSSRPAGTAGRAAGPPYSQEQIRAARDATAADFKQVLMERGMGEQEAGEAAEVFADEALRQHMPRIRQVNAKTRTSPNPNG